MDQGLYENPRKFHATAISPRQILPLFCANFPFRTYFKLFPSDYFAQFTIYFYDFSIFQTRDEWRPQFVNQFRFTLPFSTGNTLKLPVKPTWDVISSYSGSFKLLTNRKLHKYPMRVIKTRHLNSSQKAFWNAALIPRAVWRRKPKLCYKLYKGTNCGFKLSVSFQWDPPLFALKFKKQ